MVLDGIFNPTLGWVLNTLPSPWGLLLVSFLLTLLMTLAYKYFTDQNLMKSLKEEMKAMQNEVKGMKDQPDKMMAKQKDLMDKNLKYMKQSFKPTLVTMIPIILIFTWMSGHLAYEQIYPDEDYSITAMMKEGLQGEVELVVDDGTTLKSDAKQEIVNRAVTWNLKSAEGTHTLTVKTADAQQQKDVIITTDLKYSEASTQYQHSDIEQINVNYKKLKPLGKLSILGWQPGWLGIYFIFSLVFIFTPPQL